MADDSCGGSTPFKRLVDHGGQDRSLQQDRISRIPDSQRTFRSGAAAISNQDQVSYQQFVDGNNGLLPTVPHSQPLSRGNAPHSLAPVLFQNPTTRTLPIGVNAVSVTARAGLNYSTDPTSIRRLAYTPGSQPHTSGPLAWSSPRNLPSMQPSPTTGAPSGASSWAEDFNRFSAGPNPVHQLNDALVNQYSAGPASFSPNMMVPQWNPTAQFLAPMHGPTIGNLVNPGAVGTDHGQHAEADFDLEMRLWMENHGNGDTEDVDAIMEELARELDEGRRAGLPELMPTRGPNASVVPTSNMAVNGAVIDGVFTRDTADLGSEARLDEFETQSTLTDVAKTEAVSMGVPTRSQQSPGPTHSGVPVSGLPITAESVPDISTLNLAEADELDSTDTNGRQPSGVSEAARQLLKSVEHEQGDKWKQSKFLSLMRDFRDGKKDVVENELRETGSSGI